MLPVNQNSCQFAEWLIDYLYGESAPAENIRFETHLKNCSSCADEIAGFQTARSSILEWRAAEFETLTPPPIDRAAITGVAPATETFAPVFGGWRKFFSFNPAVAAAAILIACAGFVFFAVNFSEKQEIAQSGGEKNPVAPIHAPTAENANKPAEKLVETQKPVETVPPTSRRDAVNQPEDRERKISPVKTSIKNSDQPKVETTNRRAKDDGGETNKKSAPVKKQQIPNLNDLEDEADESIRLADLFAELDTK